MIVKIDETNISTINPDDKKYKDILTKLIDVKFQIEQLENNRVKIEASGLIIPLIRYFEEKFPIFKYKK